MMFYISLSAPSCTPSFVAQQKCPQPAAQGCPASAPLPSPSSFSGNPTLGLPSSPSRTLTPSSESPSPVLLAARLSLGASVAGLSDWLDGFEDVEGFEEEV